MKLARAPDHSPAVKHVNKINTLSPYTMVEQLVKNDPGNQIKAYIVGTGTVLPVPWRLQGTKKIERHKILLT